MGEVDWRPGLTERPNNGVWVEALCGDGVLVQQGDTGFVCGATRDGDPIICWGDHQSVFPLKDLARIAKPRRQKWFGMTPPTTWKPAPVDGTPDGVIWPWIWGGKTG